VGRKKKRKKYTERQIRRFDKPKPKEPDKNQIERFKEAARAVEADESDGALDKAFDRVRVKRPSTLAKR
jgi:hypothetical protein